MNRAFYTFLTFWLSTAFAAAADTHPHDSIYAAVESFIQQQLHGTGGAPRIEIGRIDPRLQLHRCERPLEVAAVGAGTLLPRATVSVRCPDVAPWSILLPVTVKTVQPVAVLARPVATNTILAYEDIRMEPRDTSTLTSGYFTDPAEVAGKTLILHLAAGLPISPNAVKTPLLIRRGQPVQLTSDDGGIRVQMQGQALSDGAPGQTIRVRNLRSRKIVEGVVTANGNVVVRF